MVYNLAMIINISLSFRKFYCIHDNKQRLYPIRLHMYFVEKNGNTLKITELLFYL